MIKIFIKNYNPKKKLYVKRYSCKYWLAVGIESIALIMWSFGLYEMVILKGTNPADILLNIGGILFTFGSFLYAKCIKH